MLIQGDGPGSAAAPGFEFGGSILERRKLTGDWGGARDDLSSRGIDFDLDFTQFLQGVTRGGEDRGFQYGGEFDYPLRRRRGPGRPLAGGTPRTHAADRDGAGRQN